MTESNPDRPGQPESPDLVGDARQELDDTGVLPARHDGIGEVAGDVIDRYELVEEIGEGGMGTVWLAQQHEPVRRQVALKVIKLGMDTREVVVRFEAERQALALMEHPHIASVLDGGSTETGRPYFVMEHVRGVPITEYCDQAKLGLRERLELFTKVCEAIQHAHHKGVIHRDIKPSNVLVALHDGVATPKVIDFGIAKATSAELTQKTLFTQHAQMIGTPEYMAPEQAELSGIDIDTRADVYALGALLYEMLTGMKLFDMRRVLESGYNELLRTIREVEPQRPSTRISTLGEQASPIAANRHVNVDSLRKRLTGDLDWVVMKALEKDRRRRYDTASSFAADISRFLKQEPVLAAPPGALYRLGKLVRRRRKTVAAAVTIAVLFVAGAVGTGVGWWESVQANRSLGIALGEKDEALARETQEKQRAERELARATEMKQLLTEMLASVDPEVAQLEDTTLLRGILDDAVRRLDAGQVTDQQVAAELRAIIGMVFRSLAQYAEAESHLLIATDGLAQSLGTDDPLARMAQSELGWVYAKQDRFGEAEKVFAQQLEACERNGDEVGIGQALLSLSSVIHLAGRLDEAEARMREAIEVLERVLGKEDPDTLAARWNLAGLLLHLSRFDEAELILREALERQRRTLGEEHLDTILTKHSLGQLLRTQGHFEEALPLLLEALRVNSLALGLSHQNSLRTQGDLANVYASIGRGEEAEALIREVIGAQETELGVDHSDTLASRMLLAILLTNDGQFEQAAEVNEKVLATQVRVLGQDHRNTLMSKNNLALSRFEQGRVDEAERLCQETLERRRATLGDEHWDTLHSQNLLARVHSAKGRTSKAEALFYETIERRTRLLGAQHPETLETRSFLAIHYQSEEQFEEAEAEYRELLELQREVLGNESVATLHSIEQLGRVLKDMGYYAEAEPLLLEAQELITNVFGEEHANALGAVSNVGALFNDMGRFAEARKTFESVLPDMRRVLAPDHPHLSTTMQGLAIAHIQLGNGDEAIPLFRETLEVRRSTLGPTAPKTLASERNLVLVLTDLRRFAEAIEFSTKTLQRHRQVYGPAHYYTRSVQFSHPLLYMEDGRFEEAEDLFHETLEFLRGASGPEDRLTLGTMANLGLLYNRMGRFDEAVNLFEPGLSTMRNSLAPDDPYTLEAMRGLADAHAGAHRPDDGADLHRDWVARQLELSRDSNATARDAAAQGLLNQDFPELHDPERALELARQACELEEKQGGLRLWQTLSTLAEAQHQTGDSAAALETLRRAESLMPGQRDEELVRRLRIYEEGR